MIYRAFAFIKNSDIHLIFSIILKDISISARRFLSIILLISGSFAWFLLYQFYLDNIFINFTQNLFWIEIGKILFYGFGFFSAIIGFILSKRVNQRTILWTWITLGVISSALIALFHGQEFTIIFGILLGFSFGLGLPSSLAFLADSTTIEERGRVSGLTIFATFLLAFFTLVIISLLGSGILLMIFFAVTLRSVAFLALIIDKSPKKEYAINELEKWMSSLAEKQKSEVAVIAGEKTFTPLELIEASKDKKNPYGKDIINMFNNYRIELDKKKNSFLIRVGLKEFSYYLFPFVIFVLVSAFVWNFFSQNVAHLFAITLVTIVHYLFIAIFGFIWGILIDRIGRKNPLIIGITILSIIFVLFSFSISQTILLIYLLASGIAWALFLTTYICIPADLSVYGLREKFYTLITVLPLIVLFFLSILDLLTITNIPVVYLFQILSLILFISLIPLLKAKETIHKSKNILKKN
ncbi:MAG: hypothetical protein AC479_04360 [miscellaneous Crenarchaeota group-6 archaeon AD8-1]|nr:MAG: hypothetical protein AC479_04360 [miscellaneous Crenarchaeota group-6 archaeon AD8-1]